MGELIYTAMTSLDGYINDETGGFEWAAPDEEVHAFVNDLERPIGTYLCGRRMYEIMRYWDSPPAGLTPVAQDYAELWQGAHKIVYSTTLEADTTPNTRIERAFDPETVRQMKASADRDLSIGGPVLAGQAITAGLVDEYRLFLNPVIVGGGTRSLPDNVRVDLELVDERRFAGVVYLRYRVAT